LPIICSKNPPQALVNSVEIPMSAKDFKDRAMLQPEGRIELLVNGRKSESAARTLAALIEEQGLGVAKVATALNGQFVPEAQRATTALDDGDRVEIVSARQGG
jgi:sulfur carrier protein